MVLFQIKSFHFSYPNQDVFFLWTLCDDFLSTGLGWQKHQLTETTVIMNHKCTMTSFVISTEGSTCNIQHKSLRVKETFQFGYEKLKLLICITCLRIASNRIKTVSDTVTQWNRPDNFNETPHYKQPPDSLMVLQSWLLQDQPKEDDTPAKDLKQKPDYSTYI